MTTLALDLVTIGHALRVLEHDFLGHCELDPLSIGQDSFLQWYQKHHRLPGDFPDLVAHAVLDYTVLNGFLGGYGVTGGFEPFDGVGVATIMDKLPPWRHQGMRTYLSYVNGYDEVSYPAFTLAPEDVIFCVLPGHQPVACINTEGGYRLWLTMDAVAPRDELALALRAQEILDTVEQRITAWTHVTMPMLDVAVEHNLKWLEGLDLHNPSGGRYTISQGYQLFRFRANERSVHPLSSADDPIQAVSLVFDRPFIGFITSAHGDFAGVAQVAFYADTDSWREPYLVSD